MVFFRTCKGMWILPIKKDFLDALKDVQEINRRMVWTEEAILAGKVVFIKNDTDKELYQKYMNWGKQLENWEIYSASIATDDAAPPNSLPVVLNLIKKIEKQIEEIKPRVVDIETRLQDQNTQKNMQAYVHNLLWENREISSNMENANKHLRTTYTGLKQAIEGDEFRKWNHDTYSLQELYSLYYSEYMRAKRMYYAAVKSEKSLAKKVISHSRAKKMAENIFTKGAWKKWRSDQAAYKKECLRLQEKLSNLRLEQKKLHAAPLPHAQFLALQEDVNKKIAGIESRQKKLVRVQERLQTTNEKLITICSAPLAQEKIEEICLGIMRKNLPYVQRHQHVLAQLPGLKKNMESLYQDMQMIGAMVKKNKTQRFRILDGGKKSGASVNTAATIMSALKKEPVAAAIVQVARDTSNKDWVFMSEFEKEEEKRKRLYRDL